MCKHFLSHTASCTAAFEFQNFLTASMLYFSLAKVHIEQLPKPLLNAISKLLISGIKTGNHKAHDAAWWRSVIWLVSEMFQLTRIPRAAYIIYKILWSCSIFSYIYRCITFSTYKPNKNTIFFLFFFLCQRSFFSSSSGSSTYLVAKQHDDHILLRILMNFSQPGLCGDTDGRK